MSSHRKPGMVSSLTATVRDAWPFMIFAVVAGGLMLFGAYSACADLVRWLA